MQPALSEQTQGKPARPYHGPFVPGNTLSRRQGSPVARSKWMTQHLISEMNRFVKDEKDPQKQFHRMHKVIDRLITNAENGDMQAIKEIFNRIEGPLKHTLKVENESDTGGGDSTTIQINPDDCTREELEILRSIARRRQAPKLEAQMTTAAAEVVEEQP